MKVRAAVLRQIGLPAPYAQSRPLSSEEVELADPGPGELRVKIHAAGLCHSDLSAINGDRPWPVPIVPGHEAAAEVIEVGSAVLDLNAGDHVVLVFRRLLGRAPGAVRAGWRVECGRRLARWLSAAVAAWWRYAAPSHGMCGLR